MDNARANPQLPQKQINSSSNNENILRIKTNPGDSSFKAESKRKKKDKRNSKSNRSGNVEGKW